MSVRVDQHTYKRMKACAEYMRKSAPYMECIAKLMATAQVRGFIKDGVYTDVSFEFGPGKARQVEMCNEHIGQIKAAVLKHYGLQEHEIFGDPFIPLD